MTWRGSQALRSYCNEIGATFHLLKEGTLWVNKAELYIGLIKELVRQDMKEAGSPVSF